MIHKVRFIWEGDHRLDLTLDKIYNVINTNIYGGRLSINILDDLDIERQYYIRSAKEIYFVDATAELRNEVIDGILR